MKSSVNSLSVVLVLFLLWLLQYSSVQAQLATLNGTNYASGSGFCFGDQQLKEGTPFISCTHSGFTGTVTFFTAIWSFDGGSTFLSEASVDGMFPGRIDAVNMEPVEGRLNILNITNLGVSSVVCRITAFDNSSTFLGQTPLSAAASISVVNTVPGPGVSQGTVSNTTIDVVLMRPNGLCEGLSDNPITYMIEVFSDNVLITTRNVTSAGATTNYTISNLTMGTLYRVSVQAVMNVVSLSNTSEIRIATLGDIDECNSTSTNNCSHFCNDTIGGYFCSCPNGYILSSNNVTCEKEDVNECETAPPPCSQICRNTVGSFICSCFSRYTIAKDGLTCNREQGPVDYTPAIAGGVVGGIVLVVIICVVILIIVVCVKSRSNSVKACTCIKKTEIGVAGNVIYEDPEENNDIIKMQSSPAYQTVSSVCGTRDDYYYYEMADDVKMEPSPAYQSVNVP